MPALATAIRAPQRRHDLLASLAVDPLIVDQLETPTSFADPSGTVEDGSYGEAEALRAAAGNRRKLIPLDGEDHDSVMFDRTGTLSREVPAWFEQ
ncbi:MAG TPA: hypothetical protein VLM89_09600 [Phycisphaerae bacterium]|nr:hypothetical protein [Phycisphaerae bacterium]